MAIIDRKRREWEMRESLILEHADALFREKGYLGLNLDHLAERIEYSKATIYNHFENKEDLVLAVCVSQLERRAEFFMRSLTFRGRSRERMLAIGVADQIIAELHPHAFAMFQLAESPSIWEKTRPERRGAFGMASARCMEAPREIVRQARSEGDLPASGASDHHILFGLVSMSKGAHLLGGGPEGHRPMFGQDCPDARDLLMANYHVFLDGTGWRPFTGEWDYADTERRILAELFPAEVGLLSSRNT
ncbi:MAG: helix-turn-helix domain-containing protein [Verrucomicrobiia bacterium]